MKQIISSVLILICNISLLILLILAIMSNMSLTLLLSTFICMFFNILLFGINKISNKQEKEFWINLQANYEREKKDVRENI